MRVLLTNDDGIQAPGIAAMYHALADTWGEFGGTPVGGAGTTIDCIAPMTVQSATGHGVTFHQPLMVRREVLFGTGDHGGRTGRVPEVVGSGVDGRPADCVKLAISNLWPEKHGAGSRPDLVISGMNSGANCGINVIYSGTVAAALEAAFLGVPAIAVSLHIGPGGIRGAKFDIAARYARRVIDVILASGPLEAHTCLSINVPVTDREWTRPGEWPAIRVCPMNTHGLVDKYEKRLNPTGEAYYWATGHGLDFHGTEEGSDVDWLLKRCVTVTPLMYDLTRRSVFGEWTERLEGGSR